MHKKIGSPQAQGVIELLRQGGKLVKMHKRAIVRGDSFEFKVSDAVMLELIGRRVIKFDKLEFGTTVYSLDTEGLRLDGMFTA